MWAADPDDDPWSEETWAKANPLYPVTPSRAFMQSAADKAKTDPVAKASFLRLHFQYQVSCVRLDQQAAVDAGSC